MRIGLSRPGGIRLTLSLLVILVGSAALGASTPDLPLSDLVRKSSTIIHGTVTEKKSRWNQDHSLIVTEIHVKVTESLRGPKQPDLMVVQPGGKVGKLRVDVDGAVSFVPGQEVVLFLNPGPEGGLTPVGLSRGSFVIETEARSNRKRVMNAASAGSFDLGTFLEDIRHNVTLLPKDGER